MRLFVRVCRLTAGVFLLLSAGGAASAQTVAQVIPSLLTERITINGQSVNPVLVNDRGPAIDHTAHFFQGSFDRLFRVGTVTNGLLATQLTTYPIGYSSGGFTYTFDPTTSTDRRTSPSFGPAFADRPYTIGKGRWNLALNYQRATFDTLEGKDLQNEIHFYFQHNDCCPAGGNGSVGDVSRGDPPFEQDLIEATLNVNVSANTVAFSASYGLTDNLDLGVVVPVIDISMDAQLTSRLIRLGSENNPRPAGSPLNFHAFPGGSLENPYPAQAAASATGIGDMVVRAKYNFFKGGGDKGAAAVGVDLRLPTGSEEDLLGTGAAQARVSFIGSTALGGRFFPHVNVGYTFSGKGYVNELVSDLRQPHEANYTFGFDSALTSNLTVAADVIGRSLLDPSGFTDATREFACVSCPPLSPGFKEFELSSGNVNLLFGSAGVRFNPFTNLLISGHLLFPLRDAGLVDKLTPVIGVEYAF